MAHDHQDTTHLRRHRHGVRAGDAPASAASSGSPPATPRAWRPCTSSCATRHVTAAIPHNHLFGASAQGPGYLCLNIADQTGTTAQTSDPAHDPGIGLICDVPATVHIGGGAYTVDIDIKPGSVENAVNPGASGILPVAILTTDSFDATTVDPLSVRFGPNGGVEIHGRGHRSDVNRDGRADLVLHFAIAATGIVENRTTASLTGKTLDGLSIEGSQSIMTVP